MKKTAQKNLFEEVLVVSNRAKDLIDGKTSPLKEYYKESPSAIALKELKESIISPSVLTDKELEAKEEREENLLEEE